MNVKELSRPPFFVRAVVLVTAVYFCSLSRNPIIYLESWLGLSPAPWERFTGFKTLFSGMSEAFHRMATGDILGAFGANFLAPPFALTLVIATLLWRWPRVKSRRDEVFFFATAVVGSVAINIFQ